MYFINNGMLPTCLRSIADLVGHKLVTAHLYGRMLVVHSDGMMCYGGAGVVLRVRGVGERSGHARTTRLCAGAYLLK